MTILRFFLITLALLLSLVLSPLLLSKAYAQDTGIVANPKKCVALHKGQMCYQRVKFSVKRNLDRKYCLVLETTRERVKCWGPDQKDLFVYDFESTESVKLLLVDASDKKIHDTFTIKIAWVYKQNKKSFSGWRWRVF